MVIAVPGTQWVRFDFPGSAALTPGSPYLIEVPSSPSVQWRSTCPAVLGGCAGTEDPDLYTAGSAPDGRDYAFRTLAGNPQFLARVAMLAADTPDGGD
jgi:hypothetical protein